MNARILIVTTLTAMLAACSTVPESNSALHEARSRYAAVQTDPQVNALAAEELKRAGESLRTAEKAMTEGSPSSTVDHLSYMATQQVVIAQETASSRASQAITAGASAERDRLRLGMRTMEADTAQRQLAQSQQDVERGDARISSLELELRELNARETPRGMVVTLGGVLFRTGQSQLLPSSASDISKLAEFLRRNPERIASIEGHTDSVGSASSNLILSQQRAQAVMTALMRMGVPAGQLRAQGFGEDNPIASNNNTTGRQMNRRVEVVIAQ